MEVDDDQSLNNEPLVIHFQPGKLADFAEVSFAAALLRNKITYIRRNDGRGCNIHALDLAQVSIPNGIRDTIYQLVDDMEKTWTEWCSYHLERVFLEHSPSPDSMIDWIDHLIWSDDGTINNERTAKNMLNCSKITNLQKYQLACSYCFIDDVERLKQTLTQDSIAEETPEFPGLYEGFLGYWNCKLMTGRLDDARELLLFLTDRQTYYTLNLRAPYYDKWPVIEYCFNQLNNEDRFHSAVSIVHLVRPRLTLYLLPKLTGSELDMMIQLYSYKIMKALVEKRNYIEYTKLIWKRMVNIINDQTLSIIIRYVNNLQYERSYINPLLWEIWCCLSEHQKKYIINEKICNFTEPELNMNYNYYFSPNFPLILDFLSLCDLERRYEYWFAYWPYLVIGQLNSENRSVIDRIMKLCIVDDQKIENFKKTNMINYDHITSYCEWLIYNGRIEEIQTYLEFCTSDSQIIVDLKKKIITGMLKPKIMEFFVHWATDKTTMDFYQYLNDIFVENESKQFLNEIITDPGSLKQLCGAMQSPNRLRDVIEIVEKFVSSEESLVNVKNDLFEQCRFDAAIEKSVFLDLIVWCFGADKPVVEMFKKVKSINQIS